MAKTQGIKFKKKDYDFITNLVVSNPLNVGELFLVLIFR